MKVFLVSKIISGKHLEKGFIFLHLTAMALPQCFAPDVSPIEDVTKIGIKRPVRFCASLSGFKKKLFFVRESWV